LLQPAQSSSCRAPTVRKMIWYGTFTINKLGKIPIKQIDQALAAT
jgi:hypothetical protein